MLPNTGAQEEYFVCPFNKCLLRAQYVPRAVLLPGFTGESRSEVVLPCMKLGSRLCADVWVHSGESVRGSSALCGEPGVCWRFTSDLLGSQGSSSRQRDAT